MNNTNNFYDELELHDTEIAIAMDDIDRTKPEKIKFIIPVLTPYMDNSKISNNTIHQNKENLMNADTSSVEVNNLDVFNSTVFDSPGAKSFSQKQSFTIAFDVTETSK